MTKKETIKKFHVQLNGNGLGDMRGDIEWLKNINPADYKFLVQLSRFESGKFGYQCYEYVSPAGTYEDAKRIYDAIRPDWDRSGRRAWNSVNIIGIRPDGSTICLLL